MGEELIENIKLSNSTHTIQTSRKKSMITERLNDTKIQFRILFIADKQKLMSCEFNYSKLQRQARNALELLDKLQIQISEASKTET